MAGGKERDGKIGGVTVKDVVGRLFNTPNTTVGLTYGYLGQAAGKVAHAIDPVGVPEPRSATRGGRTEFFNNPLVPQGALTLGEVTIYEDDPYSRAGRKSWRETERLEGHPIWEHEQQHVPQGRQLGPLYIPSNVIGGLNGLIRDGAWHGPHNWNERGPMMNPPRPWAPRGRR